MDSRERQELRKSLVDQGFHWEILDKWLPKTKLYWHKPQLNVDGQVVKERGYEMPNMNGHPQQLLKYSRLGMLPWPPGNTCRCKGCRDAREAPVEAVEAVSSFRGDIGRADAETTVAVAERPVEPRRKPGGDPCTEAGCDWVCKPGTRAQQTYWRQLHLGSHSKDFNPENPKI